MSIRDDFNREGYVVLPNLVSQEMCLLLSTTLQLSTAEPSKCSSINYPTHDMYGTPYGDALLLMVQNTIEPHLFPLLPTYSFARIYWKGSTLGMHTDRESCEVSLTLALDDLQGFDWPLDLVGNNGKETRVVLNRGDALMYYGIDVPHGRKEELRTPFSSHIFLHYVKAGGRYAEFKYDKRENLGLPEV